MLGTVPTSVPQFILLGNWLLEGKFLSKWEKLKVNKLFWILSAVYFIHLIGLCYSENLHDGLKDVRTKIPLLLLPLIFFTSTPITKKELHYLFYSFILGAFLNIAWCLLYNKVLHTTETVRDVSRFMSHIRLGFLIDMAIIFCVYFVMQFKKLKLKVIFSSLVLYFIIGLYALGLMTGLANLIIVTALFLTFVLFKQSKIGFSLLSIVFISAAFYFISNIKNFYKQNFDVKDVSVNKDLTNSRPVRAFDTYIYTTHL
jgi:O-antigen ligase